MSRCFPFPPPGYEKKARTDDVDLLKKEKHREKKHKKEKKDKEKREDKDRKEKDKSDGKHRDKKDKKERSKDKNKDKERDKDANKTSMSLEKKTSAQLDSCNGDHKLNHYSKEAKEKNVTSNEKKPVEKFNEGAMDKFVLDLCSRVNDEAKGSASLSIERSPFAGRTNHDRMVRNENGIIPMEKEKKKDTKVDDFRKIGAPISATRPTILVPNIVGKEKIENKGAGIGEIFQKDTKVDDIRKISAPISATRPTILVPNIVGKEKIENKGADIGEIFQNRGEENPRISAKSLVQKIVERQKTQNGANTSGGFYNKVEESPRISERSIEPKDKNHKRKDKKSHGKDKERDEKKKEEKVLQKINDHDVIKDNNIKNGLVVNQNIKLPPLVPGGNRNLVPDGKRNLFVGPNVKSPQLIPGGDRSPIVDGNLKKRKDVEANGFLLETNSNKKLRPTPYPSIENVKKLDPCQAPGQLTPDRKVLPPNNPIKVNNNEHKVNGKIESHPLSVSLKKPSPSPSSSSSSSSRTKTDQICQAPVVKPPLPPSSSSRTKPDQISQAPVVKPPHRDTKYLSKVLSVPKIDESFEFDDDEEWLFSSKDRVSLSSEASEMPMVWDKAVQIDTADVCALPYVIPY